MSVTPAPIPRAESAHQEEHAHPPGLYALFGTEAWERFSYYGMRALLTLYLVNYLKFPREAALTVYGVYTGLVYLTPIAGGYFADKWLGRRKAVLIGGCLMALGHLAMAFEPLLYVALGLLVLGNGFFKPNISTIVGGLYHEHDARRDGGFTIFYMGINLGAYLSPLVCGNLGEHVSWHLGFSAAAVGMTAGLAVFVWGEKFLGAIGMPPGRSNESPLGQLMRLSRNDHRDVALWVLSGTGLVWVVVQMRGLLGNAWELTPLALRIAAGLLVLALVLYQLFRGSTRNETDQLSVVLVLCAFNIFFWMGFEQAGGTMTLFADSQTDRMLGWGGLILAAAVQVGAGINLLLSTKEEKGARMMWRTLSGFFMAGGALTLGWGCYRLVTGQAVEIAASEFQSINPLLIVALAPTFSRLWLKLDAGRFATSTPTKMAIGMIILGLGFVVMYAGQQRAIAMGHVGAGWLTCVYTLHTIGELCLSPIGLSMVTKLAPARVGSLAMGFWLMSSAVANYLAGTLEELLKQWDVPIYGFLVVSSIGPALLLLAMTPMLKRWMHGA
ncbi:MAG TPA: peptide MFS transporter [Polyangiaceae bacterium]|nr:peptide MFS transporter [Polyangiaceae bacterium]